MTWKISLALVLLLSAVGIPVSSFASYSAKPAGIQYDERLMEAAELATLSARKRSHRHCWRAVKDALYEANVIPYRPTSKYAWQAGEELVEKFSFIKLDVTDPFEAPIGSILVYGGPGAGHVEFRTEDGFVSDFSNPRPSHRPLIGVYVSPEAVGKSIRE
ncbi:MAG: hypothetical protein U1F66_10875 [bacterium]